MDGPVKPKGVHFQEPREILELAIRRPYGYSSSQPSTPASSAPVSRASSFEDLTRLEGSDATLLRKGMQGRPSAMQSTTHEIMFIIFCSFAQLWTQINFGNMTVSLLKVQEDLHLDDTQLPWLTGAFALANGSFVIFFGSMADKIGAKKVYIGGCLWLACWSVIAGLSRGAIQLFVSRAMHGIAGGALIPSGIGLLGYFYEPGQRKNRVFSTFGAMAPIGFIVGALEGGIVTSFTSWSWMFYFNAILLIPFSIAAYFIIPADEPRNIKQNLRSFDWLGSVIAISGLCLIVFGLTDGPVASWAPYTYSLLIVGILLMIIFVLVEKSIAEHPIMPLEIWSTKSFGFLMVANVLGWGAYAAWQFYVSLFYLKIQGASPLLTAAYFLPNAVIGVVATFVCASTLHVLPGHYIFAASCLAFGIGSAFYIPLSYNPGLSYWYTGLIGISLATFGPDLSFSSASIYVTSSVKRKYQGTASSLVNTTINIAMSLGVGIAGIVESSVAKSKDTGEAGWVISKEETLESYRAAWWYTVAACLLGTFITVCFVRIPKTDEKSHLA